MSSKAKDYFHDLMNRDHSYLTDDDDAGKLSDIPDYPGGTPPKNRKDSPSQDTVLGADDLRRGKVYRVGGELRTFYPIGELAKVLGRKPVTIRMWERNGWIPQANYRTPPPRGEQLSGEPKGRRLYSREQVEFLLLAVEAYNLNISKKADWVGFKEHTASNWPV